MNDNRFEQIAWGIAESATLGKPGDRVELARQIVEALRSVATPAGEDVRAIVAFIDDLAERYKTSGRSKAVEAMGRDEIIQGELLGKIAFDIERGDWRSPPLPSPPCLYRNFAR